MLDDFIPKWQNKTQSQDQWLENHCHLQWNLFGFILLPFLLDSVLNYFSLPDSPYSYFLYVFFQIIFWSVVSSVLCNSFPFFFLSLGLAIFWFSILFVVYVFLFIRLAVNITLSVYLAPSLLFHTFPYFPTCLSSSLNLSNPFCQFLSVSASCPQGELLETLTKGLVFLFEAHSSTLDQVPSLGYIPRIFQIMEGTKVNAVPKSTVEVVHQLANNEVKPEKW